MQQGGIFMDLTIREAISNDYIGVSSLVKEVHNLHVEKRPDVYVDVNNPLLKENFNELINTDNVKLFVVENIETDELVA